MRSSALAGFARSCVVDSNNPEFKFTAFNQIRHSERSARNRSSVNIRPVASATHRQLLYNITCSSNHPTNLRTQYNKVTFRIRSAWPWGSQTQLLYSLVIARIPNEKFASVTHRSSPAVNLSVIHSAKYQLRFVDKSLVKFLVTFAGANGSFRLLQLLTQD